MLKYTPVMGAIVAALFSALPAHANTSDAELQQLRAQLQELRQQYEQRLQALEARLNQAQQASATSPPDTTPPAQVATAPRTSSKGHSAVTPAIGMILTGTYANLSKDPDSWTLSGFNLGGDGHGVGPGKRGFSLGESEVTFSANVDSLAYGTLTLGLDGDNEVDVEEAYVQSTALPYGLTLKGGRFFGALGYQNQQHAHTWSFVDLPLVHQAFMGGQYKQEGAQLKWVLPTTQYVELTAELGNGSAFPGSDQSGNALGATLLSARTGGDVGDSHSWHLGAAWLRTKAQDRAWGLGARPRPCRRSRSRSEQLQRHQPHVGARWRLEVGPQRQRQAHPLRPCRVEHFRRTESGTATVVEGAPTQPSMVCTAVSQSGWYVQGVYQFVPQWRVGLRYDRLSSGSLRLGNADLAEHLAQPGHNPRRTSLMLDWSPSEFQRWRHAAEQRPGAPGCERHAALPAIPDEPGCPRRAQPSDRSRPCK
jgi:hypothetical protein